MSGLLGNGAAEFKRVKLEQKSGFSRGYLPLTASIPDVVTPQGIAKGSDQLTPMAKDSHLIKVMGLLLNAADECRQPEGHLQSPPRQPSGR